MISINDVTVAYGSFTLLDNISVHISESDKIGLVGKNGAGKSTLMKLITGEQSPTSGHIDMPADVQIGYLPQIMEHHKGRSVINEVMTVFDHLHDMERELERINVQLAERTDYESADYARLIDRLNVINDRLALETGESPRVQAERTLFGLGFKEDELDRPTETFSQGWNMRIELAKVLLARPDILLLDEPTNHLDLRATEWLEDYILHFKGTVLAISHDRYFLDRIAQRCIEINEGKAELYSGNYSFYVQERQRRFEEKLKQYEKDQAKIEQLQRAAEQMHLWAFMGADKLHKRAFSMEKRIEKLQTSEKPREQKKLSVKFKEREFNGDEVLVCEGLEKSYGEKTLFHDLSLTVTGGERIALIGDNGTGKTSLLKLIMNEETPDQGYLYRGPAIRCAYLPQIVRFSQDSRSALDTMLYDCRCQPQEARDRLAAFGFRGEDVFTPVGALSGGERSRLKLCMLMGGDINLLILDEPTNHLDIWMEDALSDYEQTLLFVSHDRYFIEKFATRIWALRDGEITDFRGGYREYCAWRERQDQLRLAAAQPKQEKKEEKKKPHQPNSEKQIAKTEREIARLEEKIAALDREAETYAADYQKLMEIGAEREELDGELMALYEKWEELHG